MEVKFELLNDLLIRFPFMQTSAIWSKMVIIILDTGVWRRGAWLRRKKVLLVVFSVVVLFFDEKGCLVRRRRLLFERRRGFCGMRTEKRGVWLVTSLNMEKKELLVGKTPGENLLCS